MELPKEKSKLLWKSVKNTCRDKLNGLRSVSRMNMPGKSFLTKLAESANPRTIDKVSLRGKLEKIIPERLFRHNPVALDNKGGWKEQRASLIRNQKNAATSLLRALRANETGKKIILRALPNFSRLKNIGLQLNYQQRIYAALILIAIVAIPFLIVKYKNADPKEVTTPVEVPRVEPEKPEPLKNDLRVIKVSSLEELPESRGALQVIKVNEYIFARAGAGLVDIKSGKTFPFPPELGPVVSSAGMNDLSLIFLLGDNGTLMSFSPISLKFQSNRISIPEGSIITSMGSYLTYVYLLDSTASQIYRYPRAEGGFGEKSNWIKGESALTGITRIAVNENIFLTNQKEIFKFFKGKKQEFLLEHTETPIVPQAIYASEDGQNMYILDSINSRLVQTDTEGHILAQYYHPSMEEMKEIVIDKENNTAYLSDGNLVKVMKLSL